MPRDGLLFIGEKGKDADGLLRRQGPLLPEKNFRDFQPPPKTLTRTIGHYKEWVQACKGGKPANCNFEFASRMTEVAQLGNRSPPARPGCSNGTPTEWPSPTMPKRTVG